MSTSNSWWSRQLIEAMKEASRLFESFKEASEPNVDELDKALAIYEEYCQAYDFEMTFENFTEHGQSLRTRQAFITIHKDFNI